MAHLLQGPTGPGANYTGEEGSPLGISAELLTKPVWDFVYLQKPYPEGCGIEEGKLEKLRESFEYWHPRRLKKCRTRTINTCTITRTLKVSHSEN